MNNEDVLTQFKKHLTITESGLWEQWDKSEQNHAFYSGDEMAYRVGVNHGDVRRIVVFNRVKPFVNAIYGFMIKLRRRPDYQSRQQEPQLQLFQSEHLDSFSDYLRKDSNLDQIESRQDKENLICGVAAVDTTVSYIKNPHGEVQGEALKYSEVGWDPQARATNLLDARWVYRKKLMNRDDAVDLFSGSDPDDFEDATSPLVSDAKGNPLYNSIAANNVTEEDLVQIYYYQWWEFENYYRMPNPLYDVNINPIVRRELLIAMQEFRDMAIDDAQAMVDDSPINSDVVDSLFDFDPEAQILVMTPKIYRAVKSLLEDFFIEAEAKKYKRKLYRTAIVSGKKVFSHFKSPDQSGFTIKFKTGDYDENRKLWMGIVDQLKDPSRYANKALTEILYVIAANSKGGVMYEESAVSDPKRFEQQYASTHAAIKVNDGALAGGKIQDKARSSLPTGYENVLQVSKNALYETTGINPEFLGSSENKQVSALLESQRIEQVTSTLASYFDSITLYSIEHARLMLTYMRMLAENNPTMAFRVVGDDGFAQRMLVNMDAVQAEYDIDVQEAPTSPTQKAQNLSILLSFADKAAFLGVNILPEIVDELPISQVKRDKIRQAFVPKIDPEQQQQQAIMGALQMENMKAEVQKRVAEAFETQMRGMKYQTEVGNVRADTLKTTLEAEQKDIENDILGRRNLDELRLTI